MTSHMAIRVANLQYLQKTLHSATSHEPHPCPLMKAVNRHQKPNNATQDLLTVRIILRSENDHDTKSNCTFAGRHVPTDRTDTTPWPDTPYEWSHSNILEGHRNGRFVVSAPSNPDSSVRFRVCWAAETNAQEDLGKRAMALVRKDVERLRAEFGSEEYSTL